MKNYDFIRLGKISLKNNKKQTANTVRGLVFGSTLLITLLFVLAAFYGGIVSEINKEKTISSFILKYQIKDKDSIDINKEINERILSNKTIKESIIYNRIYLTYYSRESNILYPTITIDEIDYPFEYHYRDNLKKTSDDMHFFDLANSSTIITKEEELFLSSNNYGKAVLAGTLFTDVTEEVIIASHVLDFFKIDYQDAIGKTISYATYLSNWSSVYDIDHNEVNPSLGGEELTIISDYTIKGVFNSNLYLSPSRGEDSTICPSLWLKKEAIYHNDIVLYFGENQVEGFIYQKNPLEVFHDAIIQRKVAIPFGFNYMRGENDLRYISEYNQIIQFHNFDNALNYNKVLNNYNNKYPNLAIDHNSNFSNYLQFYPFVMLISITFLIFGGVVFYATILNLYNTMRYSFEKRKYYLSMCKAMGMTNNDMIKLYLFEILLIIFKAAIWIISLTLSLCLLITLLINNVLIDKMGEMIISYNFSFIYYPVTLIISILVIFTMAISISFFITKSQNKGNLIELLNDN